MARKESRVVVSAIAAAKKAGKSPLWSAVAHALALPSRKTAEVNLSRLSVVTKENDTVVVPGRVLGAGRLSHKLSIAALSFSSSAKKLIENAGGKCSSIGSLASSNPKGTNVVLIK